MPFGVNSFKNPSKIGFETKFDKSFEKDNEFNNDKGFKITKDPYKVDRLKRNYGASEVDFYNNDSLWSRWRRGYELYITTQSMMGSSAKERGIRGDYRLYFTFQQFPGVFIPARIYIYPSAKEDLGEHIVGMRDTDAFSFYEQGLPILGVRYLGNVVSSTYNQSSNSLVVAKQDHGLFPGENVFLDFQTGAAVDETATITSTTQNTFTVTLTNSANTSGNVNYFLSTTFGDSRWTTSRVRIRSLPTDVTFLTGERLGDRIVEKDPGINCTYSRSSSTVTVNTASAHGLSTGNTVFIDVSSGNVSSGRYKVTVISSTQLTLSTLTSGTTSGNLKLSRLIRGRRYDNYVAYTCTGTDSSTNEIIFQKKESYGAQTIDNKAVTTVPAHRGFEVGRFLSTDLRWQCSCQDFSRRDSYNLYSDLLSDKFPTTNVKSTREGRVLKSDGTLSNENDIPGVFRDLGFVTINNFYELPEYEDNAENAVQNLAYYQLRWCKHIYAAMWALLHDEGNDPINLTATYVQNGPNIVITSTDHNLEQNTKIQIAFTSGNAISGEFTVSEVQNKDTFVIVYPFANQSSGYCTISNLKKHEFVGSWLLEPSDRPIDKGLERFNKNFEKEKVNIQEAFRNVLLAKQNTKWSGQKTVVGNRNQPQAIADFDPSTIGMTLTDNIRRDKDGNLRRDGKQLNATNRMTMLINKLFNKAPTQIEDIKLGIVNKPLNEYASEFESGLIDCGEFQAGTPTEKSDTLSTIDCGTYNPLTDQDTVVDADLYINA